MIGLALWCEKTIFKNQGPNLSFASKASFIISMLACLILVLLEFPLPGFTQLK